MRKIEQKNEKGTMSVKIEVEEKEVPETLRLYMG